MANCQQHAIIPQAAQVVKSFGIRFSLCCKAVIGLYQDFCRNAKPCLKFPYHVQRKTAFAVQDLRDASAATNVLVSRALCRLAGLRLRVTRPERVV